MPRRPPGRAWPGSYGDDPHLVHQPLHALAVGRPTSLAQQPGLPRAQERPLREQLVEPSQKPVMVVEPIAGTNNKPTHLSIGVIKEQISSRTELAIDSRNHVALHQ